MPSLTRAKANAGRLSEYKFKESEMKEWLAIALFAWLTGCGLLYEAINDPYRSLEPLSSVVR